MKSQKMPFGKKFADRFAVAWPGQSGKAACGGRKG
jgi:hypothetical protein